MDFSRSVVIVGRPNVGKSRLFNRLVGRRVSIVHDEAGVTRDVVIEEVNRDYLLMDTGGIGMKSGDMSMQEIHRATEEQVDFAVNAARLILFLVDGQAGLETMDKEIAKGLRESGKQVVLVINKIDSEAHEGKVDNFYELGFKDVVWVSAEHARGMDYLNGVIRKYLGEKPEEAEEEEVGAHRIKISFVGRPNVGKSSLVNQLLKEKRLIVSDVPGTTRDAIHLNLDYEGKDGEVWPFELVDTAGLKHKGKLNHSVEYFSTFRSEQAIEQSDVVFLVLDAMEGVTQQDKKIVEKILRVGKAMVVVVNKWDMVTKLYSIGDSVEGYETEREFRDAFVKGLRETMFFLPESPIIFVSAKENDNVGEVLQRARGLYGRMNRKLTTSKVNKVIGELMDRQKPRIVSGKRFKIYYSVQVGNNPFRIRVFCNQALRLEEPYERYLEAGFNKAFQLRGCPIRFELIGKLSREEQDALSGYEGGGRKK